jgi:hypothetical protein
MHFKVKEVMLFIVLMLLAKNGTASQVYICQQADGTRAYQSRPCEHKTLKVEEVGSKKTHSEETTKQTMPTTTNASSGAIVPTPEEEAALMAGMHGMMERLKDPAWIKLAQEKGEGCWLDKKTLVKVGSETKFKGIPCRCVSWGLGIPGRKAYTFMPTRIVKACDKAKRPYNTCVK